ncbi:2-hydroxyacid dehydrogenase [Arthrobacter subterraneus]|uniref:2-hydroxyacid dehydrogenase n=1 Tax=Arthrobacter subterraneus TaxID=335973 RepID=UPI0037F15F6D
MDRVQTHPQSIKTITFPDEDLLAAVEPIPEGITATVWDFRSEPEGMALDEIDAVILPYLNAGEILGELCRAKNLKLVQTQSTGVDGVRESVGEGVSIASAAGVHAAATAELAIGLILASLRGIDRAARDQLHAKWRHERRMSLADRKVLLVGVGGIGQEIAKRLEPFEVELTRVGNTARDDEVGHVHDTGQLVELARAHEVLVVITPLTESTRHLIDSRVLAALPDGALVVNVARGPVVDCEALTAEVVSGRLNCAVDVFDPEPIPHAHPLWRAENALITPHIGGNTTAFHPRMVRLLRAQLQALANGTDLCNVMRR